MDCKFALECVASFRHVEVMDKLLPRTGAQATDYFLPGTNQEGNWREAPMELVPRTSQENARNIQQIFSGMKFTRLEAFINVPRGLRNFICNSKNMKKSELI
jgi:hypothetical protein